LHMAGPLVDGFGRVHTSLRISVTDRCNLRCFYCMPPEGVPFRSHDEILSFEEIERFVRVAAGLGVRKIRLTGGEPLVRKHVCRLVEMLANVPQIDDLALTTNGVLLCQYASALKAAGLDRLNISLDSLSREKYRRITRFDELPQVLKGIAAARNAGFRQIKLNALAIRGLTEEEVVPLAQFALENQLLLRFIEFMPATTRDRWDADRVLTGREILTILAEAMGPLEPISQDGSPAPATEYRFVDGSGRIGLIASVSQPFCTRCNRLRLTAEGEVRNCLFARREWDARAALRSGSTDDQLARLIVACVRAKKESRGTDDGQFGHSRRAMYQIGG